MKICPKCQTEKPDSQFYKTSSYCRACHSINNKINEQQRRSKPKDKQGEPSTLLGKQILMEHGIPCVMGGNNWQDLVAWACVPIEVKYSLPTVQNDNQFKWSFSPRQRRIGYQNGLFMFIAEGFDFRRVFIIPVMEPWLSDSAGLPLRTALSVTFYSEHFNSYLADLIAPFENRYDLVEVERLRYVETHLSNIKN